MSDIPEPQKLKRFCKCTNPYFHYASEIYSYCGQCMKPPILERGEIEEMKITQDEHAHLVEVTELALLRTRAQGASMFGKSVKTRTNELLTRIYNILAIEIEGEA